MALSWADEFDGPAGAPPDATAWTSVVNGGGGGNQELEYYIPEAAGLDGNSNLVLTGARSTGGYQAWYGSAQYTSAKIWTKGLMSFMYGHLDVRAAVPCAGQPGAWPAIWMLGSSFDTVGWPACGEIDVMESFGNRGLPAQVSGAAHTPTDNPAAAYILPAGDDATQFHIYSLDWRPSSLIFSVDGVPYLTYAKNNAKAWPFDQPFYVILNLALGGTMGGAIPAGAALPYTMTVDYVHIYSANLYNR